MCMSETVGVRELRQNLSRYLRRVELGERLIVTERNKPVAELGPLPTGNVLDRLIAQGLVSAPLRRTLEPFSPVTLSGDGPTLSEALEEGRGERL